MLGVANLKVRRLESPHRGPSPHDYIRLLLIGLPAAANGGRYAMWWREARAARALTSSWRVCRAQRTLGRVLINAWIGGPLSGPNRKHSLCRSPTGFDPKQTSACVCQAGEERSA